MTLNAVEKPRRKKWYLRWWGIVFLVFLGIFLSVSMASGIFLFSVRAKLKSGKISMEELFGKRYVESHNERLFGINSPALGDDSAPVSMVEFFDFTQDGSREAFDAINVVMLDEYYKTRVKFVFRHFPDASNPVSIAAALAAECAHEEGRFLEMARVIYDDPNLAAASFPDLAKKSGLDVVRFESCFQDRLHIGRIQKDENDGKVLGVKTAPTFIVDDKIIDGTPEPEDIKKAVDLLLI